METASSAEEVLPLTVLIAPLTERLAAQEQVLAEVEMGGRPVQQGHRPRPLLKQRYCTSLYLFKIFQQIWAEVTMPFRYSQVEGLAPVEEVGRTEQTRAEKAVVAAVGAAPF
jgi:hypothetical protein